MAKPDETKEKKKSARALLTLILDADNFEGNLDLYVQADGEIPEDFLPVLDRVREYLKAMDEPESAEEFVGLPRNFQEALLEYCLDEGKADFVAAALQASADPQLKKLLKKAAHNLEAAGYKVTRKSRRSVLRKVAGDADAPTGYASLVDSAGESIAFYSEPSPRTGIRVLHAILSDQKGVREWEMFHPSRNGYRLFVKEALEREGIPIIEAGAPFVRFLLERALAFAQEKGIALPEGFVSMMKTLSPAIEVPQTHPLWSSLSKEEIAADRDLLQKGRELHEEDWFKYWYLDMETLSRFENKLYERQTSPLVVDDKQSSDYIDDLVKKTVDEYFAGDRRKRYVARIQDMAYLLTVAHNEDAAKIAAASAIALEGDLPGSEIPFCLRMLEKIIRRKKPAPEEEKKDEGLIIS